MTEKENFKNLVDNITSANITTYSGRYMSDDGKWVVVFPGNPGFETIRVSNENKTIQVNPKWFKNQDKNLKKFMLWWCYFKHRAGGSMSDATADIMALEKMKTHEPNGIGKLVKEFIMFLTEHPSVVNKKRAESVLNYLKHTEK